SGFLRAGIGAVVDGLDLRRLPPASALVPDLDRELSAGVAVPLDADEVGVGTDLALPSRADWRRIRRELDLVDLRLRKVRTRLIVHLTECGRGEHDHRHGGHHGSRDELRAAG